MMGINWITMISILIGVIAIIIPIYKYLFDKKVQMGDMRFNTYHLLVKKLVEKELLKENVIDHKLGLLHNEYGIMQDRQIAVIYELRNFPEYFESTQRLLEKLKTQWETDPFNAPVIIEISYTLSYIKIYRRSLFCVLRNTYVLRFLANWLVNFEMSKLSY